MGSGEHAGAKRTDLAQSTVAPWYSSRVSSTNDNLTAKPGRRLRAGIVGGGRGAFIGTVHRIAAELDGQAQIVAGAMSQDPKTAGASAADWFLERAYTSYEDMARAEVAHENGIDFVIIATPNNLHYPVAKAFLAAGIHVICDKPLAVTGAEGGGRG